MWVTFLLYLLCVSLLLAYKTIAGISYDNDDILYWVDWVMFIITGTGMYGWSVSTE